MMTKQAQFSFMSLYERSKAKKGEGGCEGVRARLRGEFIRIIPSYLRRSFRPCLRDSSGQFGIVSTLH